MRKIIPAIALFWIALLVTPYGHDGLRGFLLHSDVSWTLSEWAYYILLLLLGAAVAGWYMLNYRATSVWKRIVVGLLALVVPVAIGFVQHPIYEDMVWNMAHDMSAEQAMPDYADVDLVVIAIADCPYCKRAVSEMNALYERDPSLRMRMVVCTADSSWLEPYVLDANQDIEVTMASDKNRLATHAGGHFPAYVLVKDGKPVCRWSNNEWGPLAKDIVERTRE